MKNTTKNSNLQFFDVLKNQKRGTENSNYAAINKEVKTTGGF